MCVCVRACVRACVCACVRVACVCTSLCVQTCVRGLQDVDWASAFIAGSPSYDDLMTCSVTPTRSDLVSMTTDAPFKAAAPELCVYACVSVCIHTHIPYIPYISVSMCIPSSA